MCMIANVLAALDQHEVLRGVWIYGRVLGKAEYVHPSVTVDGSWFNVDVISLHVTGDDYFRPEDIITSTKTYSCYGTMLVLLPDDFCSSELVAIGGTGSRGGSIRRLTGEGANFIGMPNFYKSGSDWSIRLNVVRPLSRKELTGPVLEDLLFEGTSYLEGYSRDAEACNLLTPFTGTVLPPVLSQRGYGEILTEAVKELYEKRRDVEDAYLSMARNDFPRMRVVGVEEEPVVSILDAKGAVVVLDTAEGKFCQAVETAHQDIASSMSPEPSDWSNLTTSDLIVALHYRFGPSKLRDAFNSTPEGWSALYAYSPGALAEALESADWVLPAPAGALSSDTVCDLGYSGKLLSESCTGGALVVLDPSPDALSLFRMVGNAESVTLLLRDSLEFTVPEKGSILSWL